jgi:putative membrane protein
MFDLGLAIAHHLLVFSLFGVVFAELMLVRRNLDAASAARIASLDLWYGALAVLILAVGFSRAAFAAKGWLYYSHNVFFWAKLGTFTLIGLLSVPPTLTYLRWRGRPPQGAEVTVVRRYLYAEVTLFAPLLGCAAAMARGYGEF